MVDERCAPWPPFPTSANTPLDGHLVLAVGTYPMRGVLVDVPFSMLGCAARITAITVQSVHFATLSAHPVKRIAEGRCAPAGGAFEGLGGGAWEASGAVDGGGEEGLALGGALYSGGGGGGAFFESVGGGSVEARASGTQDADTELCELITLSTVLRLVGLREQTDEVLLQQEASLNKREQSYPGVV
ncbi:hypothetical protein AK812_SmicGene43945 [Symbiodinium microadriaticum]|uniref:Uncharacterized protein n=1 Tax=Symbiodinium microadriaticum TaxID=2951 RepID=A0A1Q9BZQ0_SYMMI|nr:hypothetical protein AK812_SmicGene43945 [Symbiodinium microadriaticum]